MTKLIRSIVVAFLAGFVLTGNVKAQFFTLRVAAMPGYPVLPQDTAYGGPAYNFDIWLVNNTSTTINTPVSIMLGVDTATSVIAGNPVQNLTPGDTLVIPVTGYVFTQPFYKIGNNIVVVWPVVNGLSVPTDTLYNDVYFIPLMGLGSVDLLSHAFHLFPNPTNYDLHLVVNDFSAVEYVRIFDVEGRQVHHSDLPHDHRIPVSSLKPGVYFLELVSNGVPTRRKFIRN